MLCLLELRHDQRLLVDIRAERPEDRQAIAAVITGAFGSPSVAELVDAIRASPEYVRALSLVAEIGEQVVGHVMISHAELDDGEQRHRIATLSPLAVAPPLQGRGIGSALVRAAVAAADAGGEPLIVLEGDPRFYRRLGFEHAQPHGIEMSLPSWAPPEAAQVMRLRAYDPSTRGRVIYPRAFDAVLEGR